MVIRSVSKARRPSDEVSSRAALSEWGNEGSLAPYTNINTIITLEKKPLPLFQRTMVLWKGDFSVIHTRYSLFQCSTEGNWDLDKWPFFFLSSALTNISTLITLEKLLYTFPRSDKLVNGPLYINIFMNPSLYLQLKSGRDIRKSLDIYNLSSLPSISYGHSLMPLLINMNTLVIVILVIFPFSWERYSVERTVPIFIHPGLSLQRKSLGKWLFFLPSFFFWI